MAIAFRTGSAAKSAFGSHTSISQPVPTNSVSGDLMLVGLFLERLAATPAMPAGWTLIGKSEANGYTFAVWGKISTGEAGPFEITWTGGATNSNTVSAAYSGVAAVPSITSAATAASSTSSAEAASVTSTVANSWFVFLGSSFLNPAWPAPAGYTERYGSGGGFGVADKEQAVAGASGGQKVTFAEASASATRLLVLAAASAAGATISKPSAQVSTRGAAITPVVVTGTNINTITPTNLPAGLTLTKVSEAEWTITGTPTVTKALTSVTLEAKNLSGSGESKSFNWTVEESVGPAEPAGTYKYKIRGGATSMRIMAWKGASGEEINVLMTTSTAYGTNDPVIGSVMNGLLGGPIEVWS
jgi:hypothetical protein